MQQRQARNHGRHIHGESPHSPVVEGSGPLAINVLISRLIFLYASRDDVASLIAVQEAFATRVTIVSDYYYQYL